jgi:MoaA/NifB/PqqE/SkfB family radical SAM enzyme
MKMPDTPRLVFWELTKRCNLNCAHCRAESEDIDYSGELDLEKVKKVIDDIASFASPIMVLTGGEPLFRSDIYDIAAYAVSKDMHVALATNGTLLTHEIAH